MKESNITYSKSDLEKMRKKDPNLQAMADQWEQAFKGKVQATPTKQGGIKVKTLDIKHSHRIS